MMRFTKLLIALLILTITGCKTLPQKKSYTLPPFPKREELPHASSVKDLAEIITKQDALIAEWESWGNNVKEMLENDGASDSSAD